MLLGGLNCMSCLRRPNCIDAELTDSRVAVSEHYKYEERFK